MARIGRGLGAPAAAAALGVTLAAWGGAPAAAEEAGYRYWSFWERDADAARWVYATEGPGTLQVSDGDVLGFRFAVTTGSAEADRPRGAADFADVCGAPPGGDGGDGEGGPARVVLVLDFGTAAHAPGGEHPPRPRTECAEVGDGATAAEALASVAEPLRYSPEGLLCAIAGYPESGCAEQVALGEDGEPRPEPAGEDSGEAAAEQSDGDSGGGGSGAAVAVGVGVVVALAAAAVWRSRARRT